MMPISPPSVDELIATIKHSHLPTILCEGTGDLRVIRFIEERIGTTKLASLPCNGRTVLLAVYDRRLEFTGKRVVFLCDRDMWLYTKVPATYANLILTWGYSIENDAYAGSTIERLLNERERRDHQLALMSVMRWFSFAVETHRNGQTTQIDCHVGRVLNGVDLSHHFMQAINFVEPKSKTIDEISKSYRRKLRGKCLYQLLHRYLGTQTRGTIFSLGALMEISFRLQPNRYIERIIRRVTEDLGLSAQ